MAALHFTMIFKKIAILTAVVTLNSRGTSRSFMVQIDLQTTLILPCTACKKEQSNPLQPISSSSADQFNPSLTGRNRDPATLAQTEMVHCSYWVQWFAYSFKIWIFYSTKEEKKMVTLFRGRDQRCPSTCQFQLIKRLKHFQCQNLHGWNENCS